MNHKDYTETLHNLVLNAGNLQKNERALIICDSCTKDVAGLFLDYSKKITPEVELYEIPVSQRHGTEPPENVAQNMSESDLILCLTKTSLAHSKARINANLKGARFLSLPDYSLELLSNEALKVDFKEYLNNVNKLTELFSDGSKIRITSISGTDLELDISDRKGNCCPGFVDSVYKLGSPPDVEANIAPNEDLSQGVIVVDGSITCDGLGLLSSPVTISIEKGAITTFQSSNDDYIKKLEELFPDSMKQRKILAECGVGFNKKAELCGNMLVDEGTAGSIHFGFGSNATIGGKNNIDFHLDFVIRKPSMFIDDKLIIKEGEFVL